MRLIGWILGLVLLLGGAAEAAAKPAITDARLGVEPGLTRVVISLTQRSDFKVFTLADPYRVVIDMSEVDWKVPSGTKLEGQGLGAGMRYRLVKAAPPRGVAHLLQEPRLCPPRSPGGRCRRPSSDHSCRATPSPTAPLPPSPRSPNRSP